MACTSRQLKILLAIHKVQGNPRSAGGPCTCAGASDPIPPRTGYCATVINGAVHSKYTEADSFCESDSGKNDCQPRFQLSACEEVLVRSMKLRLL